ncbi:MAG: heme o synthase [Oligoflexia bacterium]|nr:heme o synthase [Oligoflexia bacterium]
MIQSSFSQFGKQFATYRELAKSGIVTLVLISVIGGYLIGHPMELPFTPGRLALTLLGVLLLSSGASALNQYQERHIDSAMPRTAKRPLPSGRMGEPHALLFIAISLVAGLIILFLLGIHLLALGVAAVIFYNGFYTLWWKKHWAFAAVPGAIPGAIPILMGYAAARGDVFTPGGAYLFFMLFFWQMPHFWVLALRFRSDYALGRFPTLPVALGEGVTVVQIVTWCLGYIGIALAAPLFLRIGTFYLAIAVPVCAILLYQLVGFVRAEEKSSGKAWLRFFLGVNFSLILFIAAAAFDVWSPTLLTPWYTRG